MAGSDIFPTNESGEWQTGTISFLPRSDILDSEGKIKIDILPSSVMGTQITVSPTEPTNPQEGDLWIDTS